MAMSSGRGCQVIFKTKIVGPSWSFWVSVICGPRSEGCCVTTSSGTGDPRPSGLTAPRVKVSSWGTEAPSLPTRSGRHPQIVLALFLHFAAPSPQAERLHSVCHTFQTACIRLDRANSSPAAGSSPRDGGGRWGRRGLPGSQGGLSGLCGRQAPRGGQAATSWRVITRPSA